MGNKLPLVYVCGSSDCREDGKAWKALVEVLRPRARLQRVGCQKVCEGPTCGLEVEGRLEWFGRLDSAKARAALVTLLEQGALERPLRKRMQPKRSGKLRD